MRRVSCCLASESIVAIPSWTSRTVPSIPTSSPRRPIPRNCTDRRLSLSGPPAASVWARQAHPLRDVLVDVDRLEVPGGTRVADRDIGVGLHLQLDPVSLFHDAPLTMIVQVPVQTLSPRWFSEVASNT